MTPTRIRTILEMIKFEHSVFALPFALTGALLAARYAQIPGAAPGWPSWRQIAWIIVAMVGARSAAMTMNRIIDLRYDRENPRTRARALATGALTVQFAWVFAAAAAGVLVIAAWQLNPLALKLSPVALGVLFLYSYTKRFTAWSHVVLGFCLGMSPAAAWIAIAGSLDARMVILSAAVTLWAKAYEAPHPSLAIASLIIISVIVFAITYITMRGSQQLTRMLGTTGVDAIGRIMAEHALT